MDLERALLRPLTHRLRGRLAEKFAIAYLNGRYKRTRPARLSHRPAFVTADVRGFTVELDTAEFVDRALWLFPYLYDAPELAYIENHLRPGDVFLDIGSHIGLYTLVASRAVGPIGRVLAVEADPDTFERLSSHVKRNGLANVTAVNAGVSDRDEILRLSVNTAGIRAASTFLPLDGEGIDVSCKPLMELLTENSVPAFHGAKLDIEGFEFRVLRRFFADAPPAMLPSFVIVEFQPEWTSLAGGDVVSLLEEYGYRTAFRHELNYVMERT